MSAYLKAILGFIVPALFVGINAYMTGDFNAPEYVGTLGAALTAAAVYAVKNYSTRNTTVNEVGSVEDDRLSGRDRR